MPEPQTCDPLDYSTGNTNKTAPLEAAAGRFTSSRIIRSLLIFTVAGVVLYAAATLITDYRTTVAALTEFPLSTLGTVIALVVFGWLLRGWRFYYYVRQSDPSIPLSYSVAVFLAGFALTGTPGKVGEAVKGVFLKDDRGIPFTKTVGIVLVERLMDLWGVLVLGSFSVMLFSSWSGVFLICAAAVIAGGLVFCMENVYRPILRFTGRVRWLAWPSEKVLGVLLTGRELMTPRVFIVGLVVSVVAWGMESLSMYLILDALHLPSSLLQANFVYCLSTLVGALSMLPGGIGGTEAGMVGILAVMGISYTSALPAVILIRVCTLWFAIAVGLVFMVAMLARSRKSGVKAP